ncbi:MAG: T9SS type A sorting domain-containing protein, partial [Bacteroidales bacterium]|nr:T9SS type A sorting domain-containing protein [Bacteroidales bacterium]
ISWTLGEVAVTTLQQGDIILTQGFQQSFLRNVGFATDPIKWQIAAYPNPVRDKLRIQFDLSETTDFSIEIQDVNGRLISKKEYTQIIPGDVIQVDVSAFSDGIYYFRVATTDRRQTRVISITKL